MTLKVLFETALTDVATKDVEGVGTLRWKDDDNVFRWIKNRNATAFTAKQPVCYDVGNVGSNALFKSVNMPVSADLMVAAGIAMTALGKSGGTTGCYGWVQVEGYCKDARVIDSTSGGGDVLVGSEMICVNTKSYLAYKADPGTPPIYSSHFIALETLATAGTGAATNTVLDVRVECL